MLCLNPVCPRPDNPDNHRFCQSCGAKLGKEFLFRDRFSISQTLGRGAFGQTYLARYQDQQQRRLCVLKKFIYEGLGSSIEQAKILFRREAEQLKRLNHPQIPSLYGFIAHTLPDRPDQTFLFLVQEYIDGENLLDEFDRLGPFSEEKIRELLLSLLPVLDYLHQEDENGIIIHRDIKPENIMRRRDGALILIDFGGSKQQSQSQLSQQGTKVYTAAYAPMEQMKGIAKPCSDLYALAATCVRLWTGGFPEIQQGDLHDPVFDFLSMEWNWRDHVKGDPLLLDLLDAMLAMAIKDRPQSAKAVLEKLQPTSLPILVCQVQFMTVLSGHKDWVRSAKFSPDSKHIITASWDQTAQLWNAITGQPLAAFHGFNSGVGSAEFSPDGKYIVTAVGNPNVSKRVAQVWDVTTGKPFVALQDREDKLYEFSVNSAKFSPNGKLIVTACDVAQVWDAKTGKLLHTLKGHQNGIRSANFSPDGKFIVTASPDGKARVWETATGQFIAILQGHKDQISNAKFSPDGKRIVTASFDRNAIIWDTVTGQPIRILQGHKHTVDSAVFSPDSKYILTASSDSTARLWDAVTGQVFITLKGHDNAVLNAKFSPDGKYILTISLDNTARVWETATGQLIEILEGHENVVYSAEFSPDGKRIVTNSYDKTARIWLILEEDLDSPKVNPQKKKEKQARFYIDRADIARQNKDYEVAIQDYNEAILIDPYNAYAYYCRALTHAELDDYQKSIPDYDEAIRLNRRYYEAYENRGYAYLKLKNYRKSIVSYNEAIRLGLKRLGDDPDYSKFRYSELHFFRGVSYFYLDDYVRSIRDYDQAISLNFSLSVTYFMRGLANYTSGNYKQALIDYQEAIRNDPKYAKAYHHRGLTYEALGQRQKAVLDYATAKRLGFE